jgi:hypothetical protein
LVFLLVPLAMAQNLVQWGQDASGTIKTVYVWDGTQFTSEGAFNGSSHTFGLSNNAWQYGFSTSNNATPLWRLNTANFMEFQTPIYYDNTGVFGPESAIITIDRDLHLSNNTTVIATNFEVTSCHGDNIHFYGCSGGYFQVQDDTTVIASNKGVLYGLEAVVNPSVSRNNSPFDDAAGMIVQNVTLNQSKATDLYYAGHNTAFTGGASEAVTSFLTQANTDAAYRAVATFGVGFDLCASDSNCATINSAAIRVPNNTKINSVNGAGNAEIALIYLDVSNNTFLANATLSVNNSGQLELTANQFGATLNPTAPLNMGSFYQQGGNNCATHWLMYGGVYGLGLSSGQFNLCTGAGGAFVFYTNGTLLNGTPSLSINSTQIATPDNVSIGSFNTATSPLDVNKTATSLPTALGGEVLHGAQANGTITRLFLEANGASVQQAFRRSDGSWASPTALAANEAIGSFNFFGYANGAYTTSAAAAFNVLVRNAWTVSDNSTYMTWANTLSGTTTRTEDMRLFDNGDLCIGCTTDNNFKLEVNGTAKFDNTITTSITASKVICTDGSSNIIACATQPFNTAGVGLTSSGQTLSSNALDHISFQPGLLTAVVTTKSAFHKVTKQSTVDNIEGSAEQFSCVVSPNMAVYECGASTTCASPTVIGSVTLSASGTAFDGTINNSTISANDYIAFALSSGTCATLDAALTIQMHQN